MGAGGVGEAALALAAATPVVLATRPRTSSPLNPWAGASCQVRDQITQGPKPQLTRWPRWPSGGVLAWVWGDGSSLALGEALNSLRLQFLSCFFS